MENNKKSNLDFPKLEEIRNKLISFNKEYYSSIIQDINLKINTIHKREIIAQKLKGNNLYSYINNYNQVCDFFSDDELLYKIATNIDLKDLGNNSESLKEFYKCKFLQKFDEKKYKYLLKEF